MFSDLVKRQYEEINAIIPDIVTFGKPKETGTRKRLPSSLSLDGMEIELIDFDALSLEMLENVKTLHLNNNLINSWDYIINLLNNVPELESLNVSSNPLNQYQDLFTNLSKEVSYPKLKVFILNETAVPWKMIISVLPFFPNLETLHLSKNQQSLSEDICDFVPAPSVKHLFYNYNGCSDLQELCRMGDLFPCLENLVFLGNELESLQPKNQEDIKMNWLHLHFSKLNSLNVSENKIHQWDSIDYIECLKNLTELRISNQPLFENLKPEMIWNNLVARIGNINKLNGSIITEENKIDAQRAFMRHYLDLDYKPPKFFELLKIHGQLNHIAHINLSPKHFIPVRVICENQELELTVDVRITVSEAKKLFCQKFGFSDPFNFILKYWDHVMTVVQGPETLKFGNRNLYAYRVTKNDWFTLERREIMLNSKKKPIFSNNTNM